MEAAEIRALRDSRGETQEEFAQHFGVKRNTISIWETNGLPDQGPVQLYRDVIQKLQLSTAKSQ